MLTLQIMGPDFTLRGELPLFSSLQFTRSFWGVGDLELHTHPGAPCAQYLTQGSILFPPDAPHKAFVIEDPTGAAEDLTVKGCQLKGWARRRICVPAVGGSGAGYDNFGWDRYTGPAESAAKHYATANMVAPADPNRAFPLLVCAEDQARGDVLPWQARFDKLEDILARIGETTGTGWDIRPDLAARQFVFDWLPGRDLSTGARRAIISPEMGNADGVEVAQTLTGTATTAYVGGVGEDENRMILAVGTASTGLDRRETWIDGGSLDDVTMIQLLGSNKLRDMAPGTTLKANVIDSGACRYERDWDLGDKVLVNGAGAIMAARIISVKEVYETDRARSLEVTFGSAPVTLGQALRRAANQAIR